MPDIAELTFRLADTLRDPRESLDVELKGWLELATREHQALLAKAIIALANHGGGMVIIGLEQQGANVQEAAGRPADLNAFNADAVNGIVERYAEPNFHCDVRVSAAPDGLEYPIVLVPGGHKIPIRSTRDGPNQNNIRQNAYYIRRPGPQSDTPQTGAEWDALLRRCLVNGRDDLLDSFRLILEGGGASPLVQEEQSDVLRRWFDSSLERWRALVDAAGAIGVQAFPNGYYAVAYRLRGDIRPADFVELRERLSRYPRHTGWPPFWVPTREGIAPHIADGNIECWIGREQDDRDPAHSDYWRASPDGFFFLVRGYQEDGVENRAAGTGFDLVLPTWRTGEVILHARAMAEQFGDPEAEIDMILRWTGLAGRELVTFGNPNRWIFDGHTAHDDQYEASITFPAPRVDDNLPELVGQLVRPLYQRFDFFELPGNLITDELARMRENRY